MTRTICIMMVPGPATNLRTAALCCGLLATLPALPAGCAPAAGDKTPLTLPVPQGAPVPLVGWSAARPAGDDSTVAAGIEVLQGNGSDPKLNQFKLVPSGDLRHTNPALIQWSHGGRGPAFLALAQPNTVAEANPVLQAGSENTSLAALAGKPLTLFVAFRLTGSMSVTGNPRVEEDGVLLSAGPGLTVFIAGRGRDGKGRRLASLRIKEKTAAGGEESECTYTARLDDELHLGQWYRLAFTWNGAQAADKRVTAAINGAPCPVTLKGNGLAAPVLANPAGPLLVGGDGKWNNAPILLSSFAIYDRLLQPSELLKLNSSALQSKAATTPVARQPQYETLAALNAPPAWQTPTAPLTVEAANNDMLRVGLADSSALVPLPLRLKSPVSLDPRVTSVNFWVCQPPRGKGALSLIPLFLDADGQELEGPPQLFLSEHCQPPNSRKAGLWFYRFVDVPGGARQFAGFKIKTEDSGATRKADPTDCVFIKDIGLERIDYARAPLYYVVGNYRDNFQDTHYNNMGARALTDTSGGAPLPYVLLDNLVDQAKADRPPVLDVELDAYDTADRRVWTGRLSKAAAAGVPDLFHKITVPLTQPGTYRIRGKSYNSATGEYFTTDWTKLVILKGKPQLLVPKPQSSLLEVNALRPFGRLEKDAARQITFSFATKPGGAPLSLRYAVIPYDEAVPFWRAKREVELTQTRTLTSAAPVTVAYEPKRTVELVVAELWRDGKCIEHEERPIGIANSLDKAPAFTIANQVPTLKDLAGPGKVWKTVTIVSNPGDDVFQALKRNIGEAKKLTLDIGFEVNTPRLVPIPGVYDWDLLKQYLDLAASENCRIMLYLNQKWPPEWAPVEWASDPSGQVHRTGTLYSYMVSKSVYATGQYGPGILRQFNQQLARRFLNHPGLGGYYFENEHLDIQWEKHPSSRSYHESFRQGFARFLQARYGTRAKLNAAYGTGYTAFEQVQLPDFEDQGRFPKKVMFTDFRLFQKQEVEKFVLRDQVDTARAEDPRRPIIVYGIGEETFGFLKHVQESGGIIANGGVHSSIFTDSEYERVTAVPGLGYRMEPHDVANYDPIPHGFDEMIFGMLALGGRGMHAHIFLHGWETFNYQKAIQPGQRTGLDKLVGATPLMTELRDAEKLHDPIGILELRTQGPFEPGIWDFHAACYAFAHYSPLTVAPGGRLDYLDGCKLIAIGRNTIDAEQQAYLGKFLRAGGKVVMESTAAQYSLETPDAPVHSALLDGLGINLFTEGAKLPGLAFGHDVYEVGKGRILVARGGLNAEAWEAAMPALIKWAGITGRLADSDDRFMQLHVLQRGESYYLATTHRGTNQGFPAGPNNWQGKVRFLQPLSGASYRVTEMMSGQSVGIFTPAQLAAGFDAGAYAELQMKLFKIAPA